MPDPPAAVLVVAHGTIARREDLPSFLLSVRGGRPAPEALIEELGRRYEAIGVPHRGVPLLETTGAQAEALARALGKRVLVAMRHSAPTIEDALRCLAGSGARRACVLPMAPFNVESYEEAVERAASVVREELGARVPEIVRVPEWGTEPALVAAQANLVAEALRAAPSRADRSIDGATTELVLTAHSIPRAAADCGDPYPARVAAAARAVGERLGVRYELAFQSQGLGGGEWIGPSLASVLAEVARRGGRRVVVAPIGFVADHVETLYDLDVEAAALARDLGMDFSRVPALNVSPGLIEAMAAVVRRALGIAES